MYRNRTVVVMTIALHQQPTGMSNNSHVLYSRASVLMLYSSRRRVRVIWKLD